MLTDQKTQSPTPPVHMLYEGFDNIGKDLTAFEETMGNISDNVWEGSAKGWGGKRDDEIKNEDWIQNNAPRVPDPVPPITLIERGFSTLHRTFDVFESFMENQRRFEGEVVVEPAKPIHIQPKILDTARAPGNAALKDQEPARDNSSRKQSHSREGVANATAKSSSAQGNQSHTVEKPLNGHMTTRHDTVKEDASTKEEQVTKEINAPAELADTQVNPSVPPPGPSRKHASGSQGSGQNGMLPPAKRGAVLDEELHPARARSANTQDSRPMPTPGPSRKHASGSRDSGRNDMLPPPKRRAVFDEELHSARAAPVFPHREKASPRTPVRAQGLERPQRESIDSYRPSEDRKLARYDAERDRSLSLAQGKYSAPGRDSTQRPREPRPPSMCRSYSCEEEILD